MVQKSGQSIRKSKMFIDTDITLIKASVQSTWQQFIIKGIVTCVNTIMYLKTFHTEVQIRCNAKKCNANMAVFNSFFRVGSVV